MMRHVKRGAKVWIRIFPDRPVTRKPAETRMGKGKGGVEFYVAVVKPGKVLFEMAGADKKLMHEALTRAAAKLPVKYGNSQKAVCLIKLDGLTQN